MARVDCRSRWAATLLFVLLAANAAPAAPVTDYFHLCTRKQVERINRGLAGKLLDYTANHDGDYRICSAALGQKRDMYVYLPPRYDGITAFPVMIWMHGFGQDEKTFLDFVTVLDEGIREGRFPPMVIAAPDGSIRGKPSLINNGSFYMNSKAGRFEDYMFEDVWGFVQRNFRIRPEREAHVLAGASMGGYGAFAIGFLHRESFGVLAGILPPLDIRYADCHDSYFRPYDPNCVMERDHLRRQRVIGRFYHGLVLVRERRLTDPLLGRHPPDGLQSLGPVNPVEMLVAKNIQPGEFAMFVGYAGRDEFNLGAQAEHFLDVARQRGIRPATAYVPEGRHRTSTGKELLTPFSHFLCKALLPYVPPGTCLKCDADATMTGRPGKFIYTPLSSFGDLPFVPGGQRLP